MSEDFEVCTPPFTPPQYEVENLVFDSFSFDAYKFEADDIKKFCDFRWFNCVGEARVNVELSEDSFLRKSEEEFINHDIAAIANTRRSYEMGKIELFGHTLDKGASLLLDLDVLFKFALCNFMALDSQFTPCSTASAMKTSLTDSQTLNVRETRKSLIQFFLYIREYAIQLVSSLDCETDAIFKHIGFKLAEHMKRFRRMMRRLVDLPEYVCNHAAKAQACGSVQPAHHVFHCHLEVRWLHTTTLLLIFKLKRNRNKIVEKKNLTESNPVINEDQEYENLLNSVNILVSDLVELAILRFVKFGVKDAMKQTAFNCTCVRELWILLHILIGTLEKTSNCDISKKSESNNLFWTIVNSILFKVCASNNITRERIDIISSTSTLFFSSKENYLCSSPNLFCLWLVKSLSNSLIHNSKECSDNYELLERVLKDELKVECSESHLRLLVPSIHLLVVEAWKPRNDPIVILWEYYHKRLNNSFYVPGTTLEGVGIIPKSTDKLISQVYDRLNDEKELDSFQLFVRLLGLHLQRTNDDKKFWNQLKGRIYSKFPASKMIALNELGIYHFISLFLTIAAVKTNEIGEICKKLQEFLGMANKEDTSVRNLVFLTHVAILELLARNQMEFTSCATPIITCLNSLDVRVPENVRMVTNLIDCIRPLFVVDKIQLGLPKLVGDWIHRYLGVSNHEEGSRLINYINSLLVEMKSPAYRALGTQEVETFEALWNQVKSLITNDTHRPGSSDLNCLGNLCANFALVSTKIYRSTTMLREVASLVTSSATSSVNTLGEFLTTLIEYKPLPMALHDHDTFILKSWIRCEIFGWRSSLSVSGDKLLGYVRSLLDCNGLILNFDQDEPLITLCKALHTRYINIEDSFEKKSMQTKTSRYFSSLKQWLEPVMKNMDNLQLLKRVYLMVGHVVDTAGVFLYEKGLNNCTLHAVIDLLLLPLAIRRPGFKLQAQLLTAVNESLGIFIEGLVKLRKEGDAYLSKVIQDLIVIYLPQCIELKHRAELKKSFSLVRCFRPALKENRNMVMKTILDNVRINFVKPRARVPSLECRQAIKFLLDILTVNSFDSAIISAMMKHILSNVCCIMMYAEDSSPAKREAGDLMVAIFDCNSIRSDPEVGEEVMRMFSMLCQEHLAFSSRQLFALFVLLASTGPDFVYRFLPLLNKFVEEVESKRGIGHDRALRAELDKLSRMLNFSK